MINRPKSILIVGVIVIVSCLVMPASISQNDAYAASKPSKVSYSSIQCSSKTYHSFKITWKKASGAKKYDVAYRVHGRKGWHTVSAPSNSYSFPNMLNDTKYDFKIRSVKNSFLKSSWTTSKSFTTKKSPYSKTKTLTDSETKTTAVGDMGYATVKISLVDKEKYYDKGKTRYVGNRCYKITFSSNCDYSFFSDLKKGSS